MVRVVLVVLVVVVHGMHVRGPAPRWSRPWEQRNAEKARDKDHERIAWLAQQLAFCLDLVPVADPHPDRLVAHSRANSARHGPKYTVACALRKLRWRESTTRQLVGRSHNLSSTASETRRS